MEIKPIEDWTKSENFDGSIFIDDANITYAQTGDCVNNDPQAITISAINNGVARFLNIKTEENGWSFNDIEDLEKLIDDFKNRVKL